VKALLLAACWALGATPAAAQLRVTAEVDKTVVALDDQVVLTVSVSGPQASLPEPRLPQLPNFSVYSSGKNQSISIVNGRMSGSAVYTFVLVPRAVGRGLIGPITVSQDNVAAQSEPLEVQVSPPGARAQQPQQRRQRPPGSGGGPDLFLTAELDRRKAHVNEQVTLSVKFYTAVPLLGNPEYTAPKLLGFLPEDLPPLRHDRVTVKGRTYGVTEIKTALFPIQPGRLAVGEARARCQVQQDSSVDPFAADFFERFFSQGLSAGRTVEIVSDPLSVQVEPLPENGKPSDFSGAVGSFDISLKADKTRATVGEAVNLSVTVEGRGNLKALGGLTLPELPSWRLYEPLSSVNLEKKGDMVRGSKTFKILAVPRVSGELEIPSLSLSYFDPAKRSYVRAQTQALKVRVEAALHDATAPAYDYSNAAAASGQGAVPPRGLTQVAEDIRYLKPSSPPAPMASALAAAAQAGPLHGLPFLFFGACVLAAWRRHSLALDPRGTRLRAAGRNALARSGLAAREPDSQKAAALLSEALAGYFADKLAVPASGLTQRKIQETLATRRKSLPPALIEQALSLWSEIDSLRFAPQGLAGGRPGSKLAEELADLVKALEAAWR
jgi:hypothetical protein